MMLALSCTYNIFDCSINHGLVWGFSYLALNIGNIPRHSSPGVWTGGLTD